MVHLYKVSQVLKKPFKLRRMRSVVFLEEQSSIKHSMLRIQTHRVEVSIIPLTNGTLQSLLFSAAPSINMLLGMQKLHSSFRKTAEDCTFCMDSSNAVDLLGGEYS
jgi:hypothetical protein